MHLPPPPRRSVYHIFPCTTEMNFNVCMSIKITQIRPFCVYTHLYYFTLEPFVFPVSIPGGGVKYS